MTVNVNPDFLEVGKLHEATKFGQDERQGTRWQAMYIESVELIGGQVFLGLKTVLNWTSETEYVLADTVTYENIFMFSRIQKIGTARKLEEELRINNDRLIKEQIEAQLGQQFETVAEARQAMADYQQAQQNQQANDGSIEPSIVPGQDNGNPITGEGNPAAGDGNQTPTE
jgi:hypothetical protein